MKWISSLFNRKKLEGDQVRVKAKVSSIKKENEVYSVSFKTNDGEEMSFEIDAATIVDFKDVSSGRLVYDGRKFVSFR